MNPEDLRLIEARCEAATPGPWEWDEEWFQMASTVSDAGYDEEEYGRSYFGHAIIETDCGFYGPKKADRVFIAAARTDVPLLLDKVQQQRRVIQQADSLISYLWHRGFIDRSMVEAKGKVQGIMHLLADLRVHAEWESTK